MKVYWISQNIPSDYAYIVHYSYLEFTHVDHRPCGFVTLSVLTTIKIRLYYILLPLTCTFPGTVCTNSKIIISACCKAAKGAASV